MEERSFTDTVANESCREEAMKRVQLSIAKLKAKGIDYITISQLEVILRSIINSIYNQED